MSLSVDNLDIIKKIQSCNSLKDLEIVRLEYLGKKGLLSAEMKLLGNLTIEQKKNKRSRTQQNKKLNRRQY